MNFHCEYVDIKNAKKIDDYLNSSNGNLDQFIDNLSNCVVVYEAVNDGENFKILYFNKRAEQVEKIDKLKVIGRLVTEVFPGVKQMGLFYLFQDVYKTGKALTHPVSYYSDDRYKGGWRENYVFKMVTGEIVAIYNERNDFNLFTEEHHMILEEMKSCSKYNSTGNLAASIAHDFNNLLEIVVTHTELALEESNLEQIKKYLKIISDTVRYGKITVNELLDYSGRRGINYKLIDIDKIINELLVFVKKYAKKDIEIVYKKIGEKTFIHGDDKKIMNSLTNIVLNAFFAMSDGGKLEITLLNQKLDERFCRGKSVKVGKYLTISIKDNGSGIEKEIMGKIFEPFFTTKKNRGTGLGLPSVYGVVVKSHNGWIEVESSTDNENHGTEFLLYFPLSSDEKTVTNKVEIKKDSRINLENLEVLVVDDEGLLLNGIKKFLEKERMIVFTADHGEEALKILEENSGIKIVVLDFYMPDIDGSELAERIRKINDRIKIILSTGTSNEEILEMGKELFDDFIEKPFSMRTFIRKIRENL